MSAIEIDVKDQLLILDTLNPRYRAEVEHGADCRRLAADPVLYPMAHWNAYAALADARLAEIDALVVKFDKHVQTVWAGPVPREGCGGADRMNALIGIGGLLALLTAAIYFGWRVTSSLADRRVNELVSDALDGPRA